MRRAIVASEEQINPDVETEAAEQATEVEAAQSGDTEQQVEVDVAALQAELEAARQELAETKEQALRTVAEAQNTKRRAEQEVDKARKFALEKFANELLVVADNMERALQASDLENELVKPLAEGVELTQKSLINAFGKFSIEQLDPAGEPFDPQFHQAMSMIENPNVEPNTVIAVMQKGYLLNGRLLRPAMVMVSKGSASVDEQA
jgi:molecular chaperone GrpE